MELEKNKSFKWEYKEPEIDYLEDNIGFFQEKVETLPRRKVTVTTRDRIDVLVFDKLTTTLSGQDGNLTINGTTNKISTKVVYRNWENFREEDHPNETYENRNRIYSRYHNTPRFNPLSGYHV